MFSISQCHVCKDNNVAADWVGVADEVDIIADALWRVAVMADSVFLAWGLNVKAGGIDGRGRGAGTL